MHKTGGDNPKKLVSCPVEATIQVVGGRWKVLILHRLLEHDMRFGELLRALKGVTARTLTKQLRELEADGIVSRTVHQQVPPMVEYAITPKGRELEPTLLAMHAWGEKYG
ncbi:winged helix-turn-helix transcriptional regulator [Paludisphaera rhizosphaerae]|uniref:winged helix-turn-helix transcriptional regulator n=1 Tax=Paludisphaera rhizosphaerae TaxID=2711216 RepID=UPI0013EBD60F|nr:helix-turn-helix domain-containing protein [Paludisphaera rhizosphaerae]